METVIYARGMATFNYIKLACSGDTCEIDKILREVTE